MDTRTGRIMEEKALMDLIGEDDFVRFAMPIASKNLTEAQRKELSETGTTLIKPRTRCPCGSGKRFKSCCMRKAG